MGLTPLDLTVDKNKEAAAAELRAHGAQHTHFFAAKKGMMDEVVACIEAGQDVNACNSVISMFAWLCVSSEPTLIYSTGGLVDPL